MLEFVDALERVVEGDDAAVAGVALHVPEHIVWREAAAIVACDHIPHDDAESAMPQNLVLCGAHPSARRPEEVGLQQLFRTLYVGQIVPALPARSSDMVVGVITDGVSAAAHLLEQVRILACIVADHKECGTCAIAFQDIEDERCGLWDRTIVKSKVDRPFRCIHPPACTRVQLADESWGLLNKHITLPLTPTRCTACRRVPSSAPLPPCRHNAP